MKINALINWFLPGKLRNNPLHPEYDQVYTVVSACFYGAIVLPLAYGVLFCLNYQFNAVIYSALMCISVLFFIRNGMIRVPLLIMGVLTYVIYYPYIAGSGGIYSPMVGYLYLYMIGAYWGDPKNGAYATVSNILVFYLLYRHTPVGAILPMAGSPLSAFLIHTVCTSLLGALLWMVQKKQDETREETKQLQNHRIKFLDIEIARRTEQLNSMRQSLATDFHDETGNQLSAITRQAGLLKLQLSPGDPALSMADSIIRSSNALYASGRNFLWNLNHESDDPQVLFEYLASFGQSLYNQFDISFSAQNTESPPYCKIDAFASLSLVFIFKEAMHNVIKHSGAGEVTFKMASFKDNIEFSLSDNGSWKQPVDQDGHYGLQNMRLRCSKHQLGFGIHPGPSGTRVEVNVPMLPHLL